MEATRDSASVLTPYAPELERRWKHTWCPRNGTTATIVYKGGHPASIPKLPRPIGKIFRSENQHKQDMHTALQFVCLGYRFLEEQHPG